MTVRRLNASPLALGVAAAAIVAGTALGQNRETAQQVLAAARQWEDAVANRDTSTMARVRNVDSILIDADGNVLSSGAAPRRGGGPQSLNDDDRRLRTYGDAAAVLIGTRVTGRSQDRVLGVWIKSAGSSWQIVAEQSTTIAVAPRRQEARSNHAPQSRDAPDVSGEGATAVLAAERAYRASADLRQPLERIKLMFADDYLGIVRNGELETRDQLFERSVRLRAAVAPTAPRVLQMEHNVRVRVYGPIGIVTAGLFNQGEDIRVLRVFAKHTEEWKIVHSQSTAAVINASPPSPSRP